MREWWCHDQKLGHQTTWNTCMIWSYESSFKLFPTLERVYVWMTPGEPYNSECLVLAVKHGGGALMI
jgi:hypothetical protein